MCSTFAHLSQAKCLLKRPFWKSPSPKNDQSANGPYWSYCSKQPELNYEAYKLQSGIQIYDAMLVRRLMHFSRFELHCTLFRRFPAILSYAHKQPLLSEIIRLNLLFKIRKISIEFLKCQTTLRSERGINLKWKVSKIVEMRPCHLIHRVKRPHRAGPSLQVQCMRSVPDQFHCPRLVKLQTYVRKSDVWQSKSPFWVLKLVRDSKTAKFISQNDHFDFLFSNANSLVQTYLLTTKLWPVQFYFFRTSWTLNLKTFLSTRAFSFDLRF